MMLSAASSCLLMKTNSLYEYATDLAGQISNGTARAAGGGHVASASEQVLTRAKQTLGSLGDAIAILGMAQQEISLHRNVLIQSALLKDIASICQNEDLHVKTNCLVGMLKRPSNQPERLKSTATKVHPAQAASVTTPSKDNCIAGLLWSKQHSIQRVSQPEGAGCETSNIPERVWETPEAVVAASQEDTVSPENLMDK